MPHCEAIQKAFEEVGLGPDDKVLDIGCGDGRALIEAARMCGARGVGYEIEEDIATEARQAVREAGFSDRNATSPIHIHTSVHTYIRTCLDRHRHVVPRVSPCGLMRRIPYVHSRYAESRSLPEMPWK